MNLQRKILLVVGLAVILLSAGLYLTLRFAVLAGFERLEHRIAHRTMGRIIRSLEEDLTSREEIRLDRAELAALGEQTYVTVSLLEPPKLSDSEKTLWRRLRAADAPQILIDSSHGNHLIGYQLLRDPTRQPLALVKVLFPRETFQMARTSVNLMVWLVIGVAILLGMITLALIRKLILVNLVQSLTSLNTGIHRIAQDGNPARRVKPAGRDEMGELAEGINRMLETLEQAQTRAQEQQQQLIQAHKLMALGTLVSGVAHEINNPNNVIMLNTPLIRRTLERLIPWIEAQPRPTPDEGPDTEQVSSLPPMLRGIEEASRRIQKIVESLKDFARPNPNRLNEPVDLKSVIEAALQLLDHPLHQATRHFQWHCPDALPLLTGNKQRLEQVFINLLQNACQALPDPDHKITLTVEAPAAPGLPIRVLIRDDGMGIPPENMPLLTTPFFTTQRARGGTGLGLSISLGILKEHGGDLAFESQPGVGTTVIVTLPVRLDSRIETSRRPGHTGSFQVRENR